MSLSEEEYCEECGGLGDDHEDECDNEENV